MNKENADLHNLCELLLIEERTPETISNPDDAESKNYLAAIKWKKEHLAKKIKHDAPTATQEQVDERCAEFEQSLFDLRDHC